jgi:N-acetylmuramoyl-L-alanine amidase
MLSEKAGKGGSESGSGRAPSTCAETLPQKSRHSIWNKSRYLPGNICTGSGQSENFMKPKIALRTLALLAACLSFENFNLEKVDGGSWTVDGDGAVCSCGKGMDSANSEATAFAPFSLPPYRIKTVVLDAGHGGKDPGCIGASAYEKDNALAIVLRLGAYIQANYPEVRVIYTRDKDVFVELNERAAIANRNAADLFISVHCNAISAKTVKGTETYVLGLHRTKENLEVAKRENAAIFLEKDYQKNYAGYDPNSPEAEIFANLWQSAYLEQSILLASYVQQFSAAVAFREDRGVKQAGFLVLRETAMPSVLIEAGFLTHATEDEFLASDEGREQMAVAIFQAFEAYKRHVETGKPVNVAAAAQKTPTPAKTEKPQPAQAKPVSNAAATATKGNSVAQADKPAAQKSTAAPTYTIFLLSWPNKLDPNVGQLSLLTNVSEVKKEGKYQYYMGNYTSKADAEKVLPELFNMGFKSAAIVQN